MEYTHTTFLGDGMSQTEAEFRLWETILTEYDFKRIIDLGTWKGNHALYLNMFAINRGADFYTYDNKDYEDSPMKQFIGFDKSFFKKDIFKEATSIRTLIKKPGRTILFCDDGDKIREFRTFKPYLKVGDVIAVHDWGTECKPIDVNTKDLHQVAHVDRLIFFERIASRFRLIKDKIKVEVSNPKITPIT